VNLAPKQAELRLSWHPVSIKRWCRRPSRRIVRGSCPEREKS